MTKQQMVTLLAASLGKDENPLHPKGYQPTMTGFAYLIHDVLQRCDGTDAVRGTVQGFYELQGCDDKDDPVAFIGWRAPVKTTGFMTMQGGTEELVGETVQAHSRREKAFGEVEAWVVQFDWDGQPGVLLHCEDGVLLVTSGITEDGYFGDEGGMGYLVDRLFDFAMWHATDEAKRRDVPEVVVTVCEEDTVWAGGDE